MLKQLLKLQERLHKSNGNKLTMNKCRLEIRRFLTMRGLESKSIKTVTENQTFLVVETD